MIDKEQLAVEDKKQTEDVKRIEQTGSFCSGFAVLGMPFSVFFVLLCLCFCMPLLDLVRFALDKDLHSHILLVPFISAYLIWLRRKDLPRVSRGPWLFAIGLFALGVISLGAYFTARNMGAMFQKNDYLSLMMMAYLFCLAGGCVRWLGVPRIKSLAFPLAFLVFMVPMPTLVIHVLEIFFQRSSAEVANWFFMITGTPVLRDGLVFQLPGISIRVAEECSGIRSSFVLFMTSLLAGYMFLNSWWRRSILSIFVIPLGIARNAFRILTISLLCIHVDSRMIDSPIHHRGGPVFFVLSLVPFFALLYWLRAKDRKIL